jgi:general stress protein 26
MRRNVDKVHKLLFHIERAYMTGKSLADIAREMAGIDIAILSTHTESGEIANRPMSNNGDVAYDGTSCYFTYDQARAVSDIQRNPKVALGFSSESGIFSDGIYVAVEGTAEMIRDKSAFQQHWTSDLDKWFDNGIDTPGIVLIKVKATRVTHWKGREDAEIDL